MSGRATGEPRRPRPQSRNCLQYNRKWLRRRANIPGHRPPPPAFRLRGCHRAQSVGGLRAALVDQGAALRNQDRTRVGNISERSGSLQAHAPATGAATQAAGIRAEPGAACPSGRGAHPRRHRPTAPKAAPAAWRTQADGDPRRLVKTSVWWSRLQIALARQAARPDRPVGRARRGHRQSADSQFVYFTRAARRGPGGSTPPTGMSARR